MGFTCDVTTRKAVMETAALVQQQIGHVTILINNAAICLVKPVLECSPEELYSLMDTNLIGHFWVGCLTTSSVAFTVDSVERLGV
jgi:meso-butanediol dehydrogenase/(S,S)-butanediol dehydrogenase/diacetyl reductase